MGIAGFVGVETGGYELGVTGNASATHGELAATIR